MTDKERLVELLKDATPIKNTHGNVFWVDVMAQWLIDNGVTFATDTNVGSKWISVEDRLPGNVMYGTSEIVLAWISGHGRCFAMVVANEQGKRWFSGGDEITNITHWMPLPEPPEVER